jgi:hypothetical protein
MAHDPKVHDLAALFVADLLKEVEGEPTPTEQAAWIEQVAEAGQVAMKAELEDIRTQLEEGAKWKS